MFVHPYSQHLFPSVQSDPLLKALPFPPPSRRCPALPSALCCSGSVPSLRCVAGAGRTGIPRRVPSGPAVAARAQSLPRLAPCPGQVVQEMRDSVTSSGSCRRAAASPCLLPRCEAVRPSCLLPRAASSPAPAPAPVPWGLAAPHGCTFSAVRVKPFLVKNVIYRISDKTEQCGSEPPASMQDVRC